MTHDVREALMLATKIALLRDGDLDVLAPPGEFANAKSEEAQAFLECLDWKAETP